MQAAPPYPIQITEDRVWHSIPTLLKIPTLLVPMHPFVQDRRSYLAHARASSATPLCIQRMRKRREVIPNARMLGERTLLVCPQKDSCRLAIHVYLLDIKTALYSGCDSLEPDC